MTGIPSELVPLSFVGGIDAKADALHGGKPSVVTNWRHNKTGALERRYGFDDSAGNIRNDGSSLPTPEMLVAYGDELLTIGAGDVDTYKALDDWYWIVRGQVPDATVVREDVGSAALSSAVRADPDVGYETTTGTTVVAWATYDGTNYSILATVRDDTTKAHISANRTLETLGTALTGPRVVVVGTSVVVLWWDNTNTRIRGAVYDAATGSWAATATAVTGVTNRHFDAAALGSTLVVAYWSGTLDVRGLSTAFATTLGPTTIANMGALNIAVRPVSGERVWVASSDWNSGASWDVRLAALTTSLGASMAAASVFPLGAPALATNVVIERWSATQAVVAYSDEVSLWSQWRTCTTGGVLGTTASHYRSAIASRPFVLHGRMFVWVLNQHRTHQTHFLIDMHIASGLPSGGGPRIVAVAAPRQLTGASASSTAFWPRYIRVAAVASVSATEVLMASIVAGDDPDTRRRVILLRAKFNAASFRTATEAQRLAVLSGGVPCGYDGARAAEIGFAYEPDIDSVAAFSNSAGGGLDASSNYSYKFCYAWTDAKGNIHRSIPSAAKSASTTAGNLTVTGTVPPLHLTNRMGGDDAADVDIEVYRTESVATVAGSTYYYVKSIPNVVNSAAIAFTDDMADTTLTSRRQLYTTGGTLDRVLPPSASLVATYKNAPVLAGTDDDTLWIGGTGVQGEGPWFNDGLVVEPFDGGRITALAALESALILFKESSIFVITGDPPNDLGASGLSAPQRLSTDVGCDDPNSVVTTADGVYFFSAQAGLCLLDRSFGVQQLGRSIEGLYPSATSGRYFAGVGVTPDQHCVRFVEYAGSGRGYRLDTYHSQVYQAPVWTRDLLLDNGAAADIRGACVYRGVLHYITASGTLYAEKTTASTNPWLDTYGATNTWIPTTLTTHIAGGPQLFNRIRRVLLNYQAVSTGRPSLTLTLTSNLGTSGFSWTATELASLVASDRLQLRVHNDKQKVAWMTVTLTDSNPGTLHHGTGFGLALRDIALEIARKTKGVRTPAANQK